MCIHSSNQIKIQNKQEEGDDIQVIIPHARAKMLDKEICVSVIYILKFFFAISRTRGIILPLSIIHHFYHMHGIANLHCCQFWLPRKQPVNHKELYNVALSKQLFHFQTLHKICQVCWASKVSPTLGCLIEISLDIYMLSVCLSYVKLTA